MNMLFVLALLAGVGACFGGLTDLFPQRCKVEEDCRVNKCCMAGRVCLPKLQENYPCVFVNYTKCGCADGLECKVTKSFEYLGKVYKFKQCKAVDVPVIPEELKADSPRQKRFLIRSCENDSDCGVQRCCSSVLKKCLPVLPKGSLCETDSCCGAGRECQVAYTLYHPLTGKKIIDVKQCKDASAPPDPQALLVSEA